MTRNNIITISCMISMLLVLISVKLGWIVRDGFIVGSVFGFVLYHFAYLLNQHLYKE